MPLSPEELQAARLESMMAESRMPREPKTETRLGLHAPTEESPIHAPEPKIRMEKPFLEKNKRYKTWSLR